LIWEETLLLSCGMVSDKKRLYFRVGFSVLASFGSYAAWVDSDLEEKQFIRPSGWIRNAYHERSSISMNETLSVKFSQLPTEANEDDFRLVTLKDTDSWYGSWYKNIILSNQKRTLESNIHMKQLYFKQHPEKVVGPISVSQDVSSPVKDVTK
jgi:hypothetical protein